MISEVIKKFGIHLTVAVNIVLKEDGTMVDDVDYFQHGLESSNVLMLLKSDEAWTERGTVVPEVYDDDDDDHAEQTPSHCVNFQLKNLCSRLRRDLKQVLLFTTAECQMIVDADRDVLCRLLHEVESIQTACQRYVDDHDEYNEAIGLLQIGRNILTTRLTMPLAQAMLSRKNGNEGDREFARGM